MVILQKDPGGGIPERDCKSIGIYSTFNLKNRYLN